MSLYSRWILSWEHKLTRKDPYRQVYPFDWGLDWIGVPPTSSDPLGALKEWSRNALADSDRYFEPPPMQNGRLEGDDLRFETPLTSPFPENNTARAHLWRLDESKSAVIVVPQWNADAGSHVGLCRLFAGLGFTVARITMPYHEERTPGDMKRADLLVGPSIGRTLHATRQAVFEIRQVVRWLRERGYERIGIVGTSLGSCLAYLAFTHEPMISAAVFNHVAALFADVVWLGLATRYVRWGLDGHIGLEDLRECWAPMSPWHFIDRLKGDSRRHLLVTARYDLSFLPELSEPVFWRYTEMGIPYQRRELPCGHYTTAHFPFKYLDGYHIGRFLTKALRNGGPPPLESLR